MRLDVVGVTVEPVLVIGHDDVGPVLADQGGKAIGRGVDRSGPERFRCVVGRPAHHSGVGVPEQCELADAQDRAALGQFVAAHLRDRCGVVPGFTGFHAVRTVSAAAVGAHHHNRANAFGGIASQYAAGAAGLVVGMRVHGHESQRTIGHALPS